MKQPGYILLLTLMMLSVGTVVVTQIFFQGHLYNLFIPLVIEKEKARQIVLSGVAVACSQLSLQDARFKKSEETKGAGSEEKKDPKKEKAERSKNFLKTLLLVQGRWQNFTLTQEADGIDAQLAICVICQEGKLNLNQLYDFKKHEFVKVPMASGKELFAFLGNGSKPFTKNKNIFEGVEERLKKQEAPFVDVTQLLEGDTLEFFKDNLFYEPSEKPFSGDAATSDASIEDAQPKIYLTDLFTVDTESVRINPWVLSPSLFLLFTGKPQAIGNSKEFEKDVDELLEKLSLENISWEKDWDRYLKPFYKIDFKSIPKEVQPFLSTKFEPRLFSVLCYGKVGRVTQKLLALLERKVISGGESIFVKKVYWL